MEIKFFSIKLLIFICLLFFAKNDLVIIGPNDLVSRYSNQPIEIVFRNIQDISIFYIRGEVIFENSTSIHSACNEIGILPSNTAPNEFSENFKILLAYYGECSLIQKARNAQNAGASMLLLINNNDQDIKNVFLEDENSGNDIKIPVGLISLSNGKIMQNYIENNPKTKIIVEINFQKKEAKKKIELKFFFSSSELKAYQLINNITKYSNQLSDQVDFIPIYVTHQSPSYNPEKATRELNCVSKGKYCYFPKETTIIQDGQRILIESLRQKCMFIKSKEKIKYYYEYIDKFYYNCLYNLKVLRFNERCSKQTLDNLGYPIDYLDDCVAESFGVTSLLSSSYIDNENNIFKNDYNEILKYKLTSFPAVIIDDKPLEGIIKENKIMEAICNALSVKPDFCALITGETKSMSRKRGWIYFLIFVIICINVYLFFKCRKYILIQIGEKIDFNKMDINGRINNVVQNYISLKENQGNDYQFFDTNPSINKNKENNPSMGAVNTV